MLWHSIPPELFQIVLGFLDLESIKSLRLVERSLSHRCLGSLFMIRQPAIDLTRESFDSLDTLIRNPILRTKVRHITVVAIYFAAKEAEGRLNPSQLRRFVWKTEDIDSDIEWLREQREIQHNVPSQYLIGRLARTFKQFENLDSIELDAGIQLGPQLRVSPEKGVWPEVWTKAAKVHGIVIAALAGSKVSVSRLSIYRDLIRCSVFLTDHTLQLANLSQAGRDVVGAKLHTLKLSLCTEMVNGTWGVEMGFKRGAKIYDESFGKVVELPRRRISRAASCEIPGIVQLLKSTPRLRHLVLHFYSMSHDYSEYDWIFKVMSEQVSLPELEVLSLAGFPVTQDALLRFLTQHESTIKYLTLSRVTITTGTWEPIFEHLSTKMLCLDHVHFSTLEENNLVRGARAHRRIIHLQAIWEQECPVSRSVLCPLDGGDYLPCGGGTYILHRRSFGKDQLCKGLKIQPAPTSSVSSPEAYDFKAHLLDLYGPPTLSSMCSP